MWVKSDATAMTTAAGLLYASYRESDGIAELPQEEDEEVNVRGEPEPVSLSYRRAVVFVSFLSLFLGHRLCCAWLLKGPHGIRFSGGLE